MNPEFRRNVWLELTPRRMGFMLGLLALIFATVVIAGGKAWGLEAVAQGLYFLLVVLWGTRNAAGAVVGEMQDRTWDLQRLSALTPGAMTWGKLFGSTIYNWFGGALCLVVMLALTMLQRGAAAALVDLVYYVLIGVIAQAGALLASLVAVARRQSHMRLGVYFYQLTGLVAALLVFAIWNAANPEGVLVKAKILRDTIPWWGLALDARVFLLLSLALFTAWLLVACYREMRIELKVRNGPGVWLGWIIFLGIYTAGFDAWVSGNSSLTHWDFVALRLALGLSTFTILTYVTVLLEPKDRVLYRWLGSQLAEGRIGAFFAGLQGWMMSYAAALLAAVGLIAWVGLHEGPALPDQLVLVAAIGFFTRDVGIFVLMQMLPGHRRGDLAALASLFVLYVLLPAIANGLGTSEALALFLPVRSNPMWLGAVFAWAQAIGVIVATILPSRLPVARPA